MIANVKKKICVINKVSIFLLYYSLTTTIEQKHPTTNYIIIVVHIVSYICGLSSFGLLRLLSIGDMVSIWHMWCKYRCTEGKHILTILYLRLQYNIS